ncbi:ABC transporter permease [Carboxylicivirga taeanensis]|uniref:ABC transporter permease n=1 Tax=Carboxylicivirga taeanensis TaxID=1416875 RepID=UPI003F6E2CC1
MINTKEVFLRLRKKPLIFVVNAIGMSLSATILILIGLHITSELSFDSFQQNRDRIVRVQHAFGAITPPAYGPYLAEQSAAVESFLRTNRFHAQYQLTNKDGEFQVYKINTLFADSTWYRFFQLNAVYGDAATCLSRPESIVLTQTTARKLFGDQNPVGQKVSNEGIILEVTAVVEDYPYESVFAFEALANVTILEQMWGWNNMFESFGSNNFQTFLLLKPQADVQQLENLLGQQIDERLAIKYPNSDFSSYPALKLVPFKELHFNTPGYDFLKTASKRKITVYTLIALFILLVSVINYVNIATVRSFEFAKSMALKKSFGASRLSLSLEIILEAVVIIFISLVVGLIGAKALLPYVSSIIGKPLLFNFSVGQYILLLTVMPLLIGGLSGLYPALMLSRIDALPQKHKSSVSALRIRQSLSLLQFTGTLVIIVAIAVIYLQNSYMLHYDTGLQKENVLEIGGNRQAYNKLDLFKNKLEEIKGVDKVSYAKNNPVNIGEFSTIRFRGEDEKIYCKALYCSPEVLQTFGMELVEGRCFTKEEASGVCLINETAARKISKGQALESFIDTGEGIRVLGVVKDFNITSLHEEILPLVLYPQESNSGNYYVKISGAEKQTTIEQIRLVYKELFPNKMFDYSFVDETYQNMYRQEIEFQRLMPVLGLFAIIISCLGLFMLTLYVVQKRSKEIAIRRVNGAKLSRLMVELNRNVFRLIISAFVLATPIAYLLMHNWLSGFRYKIALSAWIFIGAGCCILIIALLTTTWHTIRAGKLNPVDILRDE